MIRVDVIKAGIDSNFIPELLFTERFVAEHDVESQLEMMAHTHYLVNELQDKVAEYLQKRIDLYECNIEQINTEEYLVTHYDVFGKKVLYEEWWVE